MGEQTGALAQVLETISTHAEKSAALRMKLRSATIYPGILTLGSLLLMLIGPPYLLQGHLTMLSQSGTELPWSTRALIGWNGVLRSPFFVLGALLVSVGLVLVLGDRGRRRGLWLWLHRVPILEALLKQMATARFCQGLEVALKAGMPVIQALPLVAFASNDPLLEERISVATQRLAHGESVSRSLAAMDFFQSGFASLLESGEEAGKLPLALGTLAHFAEMHLDATLERFTTLIEPVILLFMGAVTAAVLVATLTPTITILQTL